MSFIMKPVNDGEDFQLNGWSWRPILELIHASGHLSQEQYERLSAQGAGGKIDAKQAAKIVEAIDAKISTMRPGESVRTDGNEAYSTSYESLVKFRDFCKSSGGFTVY